MPEEFKLYELFVAGIVGWSAGIVGVAQLLTGDIQLYFCIVFSVVFWISTLIYFYHKTHKKPHLKDIGFAPSIIPLTPEIVKPTKPKIMKHPKWTFLKNFFFITLEVVEMSYFFSLITTWEIVRIQTGDNIVSILTYQNAILSILFVIGIFLAFDLARRLRHPRIAFFE